MWSKIMRTMKGEKKRYKMPSKRGFIVWTDEAIRNNVSIKNIKITLDEFEYTVPFYSYKQVKTLEKALRIPIIDLTSGRELPEDDLIKVFHPDIIQVSRF